MVKEPCPSIPGRTPQVHLDQGMLEEQSGKASWRRSSGEGHVSSMSQAREGTSLEGAAHGQGVEQGGAWWEGADGLVPECQAAEPA